MRTVLILIPVLVLVVAWLFGAARLKRAFVFFSVWAMLCATLYVVSTLGLLLGAFQHPAPNFTPLLLMIGAVVLMLPSFWFATLFSVATSAQIRPAPVEHIAEAYKGLDENHKKLINKAVHKAAPLVMKNLGNYLKKKGWNASGNLLREGARAF